MPYAVLGAFVEDCSGRSTERMLKVHRDTIIRDAEPAGPEPTAGFAIRPPSIATVRVETYDV